MSKFKVFDILNHEKMTPAFLKLAKIGHGNATLEDICKNNGEPFVTDDERNKFITDYYKQIYKKDPDVSNNPQTIEEFLGPEILAKPHVINSKVPQNLAKNFEQALSLHELDQSISECNTHTSPGIDGVNFAFLKNFWNLLRTPLKQYADYCFANGTLTQNFKTAAIRLIPKKGDTRNIKNWRPISLLNCSYKIISRVINNRLKTVADKLLGRAQKGFNPARQIHEVLINIIETISTSNSLNIPTAILSLDQEKAFDSIDHNYIRKVLIFFGFGPNFTRMLTTITTGRNASIILPSGTHSQQIELERGNTQGDCPSPLIFNLCNQILLFKLEHDQAIRKSAVHFTLPVTQYNPDQNNQYESNRETGKVDAFADDATCISDPSIESLTAIKNNLVQFSRISGLKCNLQKTFLMITGTNGQITDGLDNLGFTIVDKINLLGFELTSDLIDLEKNFNRAAQKMISIVNFWSRFRLSIPGRINVAKTFLYAQIGYFASILTPQKEQLILLDKIIKQFVNQNLNFPNKLLTEEPTSGGLGIFDIMDYANALQATWVKRCHIKCHDNWRHTLKQLANGNPLLIHPSNVKKDRNPIIYNISVSWAKFASVFYRRNNNIDKATILNNPLIKTSRLDNRPLNIAYFRQNPQLNTDQLAKTRISDLWHDNHIRDINTIRHITNLNISPLTYMRLTLSLNHLFSTLKKIGPNDGTATKIENFLQRFKKGSKPIRAVLSAEKTPGEFSLPNHARTFLRLNEITLEDESINHIKKWLGDWNSSWYPTKIKKNFILKFISNKLPVNVRLAHMVPGVHIDRSCTFCNIAKRLPAPEETFSHLFWDCPTTQTYVNLFVETIAPETQELTRESQKTFWLTGISNLPLPPLYNIARNTMLYCIWETHLAKKIPSCVTIHINWKFEINKITAAASAEKIGLYNNNYFLCRQCNGE